MVYSTDRGSIHLMATGSNPGWNATADSVRRWQRHGSWYNITKYWSASVVNRLVMRQDCGSAAQRVSSSNSQGRRSSAGPDTVR